MAFEKEIAALADAEKQKKSVGPISDRIAGGLSLDDAHAICECGIERRVAAGDTVAGYKVGFTNIAAREKMGWPDPMYGYVMDSMVLNSGSRIALEELIAPKIECEICFKLARRLTGRALSIEDVLSATEGVGGAFEICDSRFTDWRCPFPDIFADNGWACRVVLSDTWHAVRSIDLCQETVVLTKNGEGIAEGKGVSAMTHPAKAVSWLAAKLAERGKFLEAGQIVMTGTLTPILPIEKGATYSARFSSMGAISVAFV
jgi:2-keto-4-pentenoate hydratase